MLVLRIFQFFFKPLILLLNPPELLIAHSLLLVELLIVAFVLYRCVLLERSPLVLQLGNFFLQAFFIHPVALLLLHCFWELPGKLTQFVGFLLNHKGVLLSQWLNYPFMAFLFVGGFLSHKVFETGNFCEVLLFFQENPISFKVCILNAFFAVVGQRMDWLFFFLIKRDTLFLILKQRNKMIIFFCSQVKLLDCRPCLLFNIT